MNKKVTLIIAVLFSITLTAQRSYEIVPDNSIKIFKGLISKEILTCEPSFNWYKANETNYKPNADAVAALKSNGHKIKILAFGGTWCGDTQSIVPKFYQLLTAAGFLQSDLTFYGVDRSKKTGDGLTEKWNIVNVPTFIILKDGIEQGRVVEYGKTGQWDKELGEIVKAVQ
jgi:thiol-disulfide isomerase/thioredoxin